MAETSQHVPFHDAMSGYARTPIMSRRVAPVSAFQPLTRALALTKLAKEARGGDEFEEWCAMLDLDPAAPDVLALGDRESAGA